ncbi:PrsW family intramembrane metalloprotease [Curtobacterium sp. MCBD17_028]|uniref:PrsW family intramembrane metalloprotease n=1 Tax=Curtobacterium sp. MCBD17_028 TaxID=2175670 RepID=UPI000DA776D2|nr:PrsW family intramembrane metalloprotease [Curtobacterium sp. MCBD17_028]PZE27111.1 PrsW family intramembrane metalloprotease [Curtobacterium sp. MCBD17_028]
MATTDPARTAFDAPIDPDYDDVPRPHAHHRHGWWWKTLLLGLALWLVTIVVTVFTRNTNLVPTIILLGSFLVPFTVVLFVIERVTGTVSTMQLIVAFFVGGILGVLGASVLEANLHQNVFLYIAVGFVEEFVKGVLLLFVGWRVRPKTARQGALLGATVGAGFAAFESAGYAFNAAITQQGIDLFSLLQTEVIRAVLSPVGHVLWTAILGAVIFGLAHGSQRIRWSWLVLVAYVGVALLHGLWDSTSEIAALIALLVTGNARMELMYGTLPPGSAGAVSALTNVLYLIGIAIVSVVGVIVLVAVLVHYRRRYPRPNRPAAGSGPEAAFGAGHQHGGAVDQRGDDDGWGSTPPPHVLR